MLRRMPAVVDPNVLVGSATRDDAAVYRLNSTTALVFTTDFFSPVVDDPFDFGRIAASNALSDVYAMGARPLMALNIVGFPARTLPLEILEKILSGGAAAAAEAEMPIVGVHSIDDPGPKYGMAVLGLATPSKVLTNVGARPGDKLVLTKPLGSGVVATAIKKGLASPEETREVTELMASLNKDASLALMAHRRGVRACTDVTGFGLLGHLMEMLEASGVGARLRASEIPILESARRHAAASVMPGGSRANLAFLGDKVTFEGNLAEDETERLLLADAQTSGGLLASVSSRYLERVLDALGDSGAVIGEIVAGEPSMTIVP